MTGEERERVAERVAQLKAAAPECIPFIRSLFELGMIPGWRSVRKVYPRKDANHEHAAAHV